MSRPKALAPFASPDDTEQQFYEALQRADLDKLMSVWSDDDEIACVHPGGSVSGRPGRNAARAVLGSLGLDPLQVMGPG